MFQFLLRLHISINSGMHTTVWETIFYTLADEGPMFFQYVRNWLPADVAQKETSATLLWKPRVPRKLTYIIRILSNCQFLKKDFAHFSQFVKSVTVELWNSLHDLFQNMYLFPHHHAPLPSLHWHRMQVSYSLLSYVFKDIYKFHVMYLNTKFVLIMVPYSFLFWKF